MSSAASSASAAVTPRAAFGVERDRIISGGYPSAAVSDPAGRYLYVAHEEYPGRVDKLKASDLSLVSSVTLTTYDQRPTSMIISPDGDYAYVGGSPSISTGASPVTKIRLSDMQRVGSVMLDAYESHLRTAVIDPTGEFGYFSSSFGLNTARVVKVRLSDMQRIGSIAFGWGTIPGVSNWDFMSAAAIDPAGTYAYFFSDTAPSAMFRIRLSDFTLAGQLNLGDGENYPSAAVISPDGTQMLAFTNSWPGRAVRINLTTFTRTNSYSFGGVAPYGWSSAFIDATGTHVYATSNGYYGAAQQVLKLRTTDLTAADAVSINAYPSVLGAAATADRLHYFGYSSGNTAAVTVRLAEQTVSVAADPESASAVAGAGEALVRWTEPVIDGGFPVVGYLVEQSVNGGAFQAAGSGCARAATAASTTVSCTASGLTKSQPIKFRVAAITAAGTGSTTTTNEATPTGVPDAPTIGTASSDVRSATVTWDPPSDDGSSTITGYTVSASPGTATCTAGASARNCTVSGLLNGTEYSFTVTASNAVGTSATSDAATATTPNVPSAPQAVTATAATWSTSVSWTAPTSDGGRAITGYHVTASPGTASCTATAPATSCNVSGLYSGWTYTFTVTATNAVGTSAASAASASVQIPKQQQTIYGVYTPPTAAYGSSFTVYPFAYSGLPVTLAASGVCTAAASLRSYTITMTSGSGDCTLTFAQAGNLTYEAVTATAVVAASKAAQTGLVVESPATVGYGESFTASAGGGQSTGELSIAASAGCTVTSSAATTATVKASSVGVCTMTVTRAADANWAESSTTTTVDVTPATLTLSAENSSSVYGDPDGELLHTVTGYVAGDTSAVLSGAPSCSRETGTAVGTYTVTCLVGTLAADNYVIDVDGSATHTITRRPVTVRAADVTFRYADAVPKVGYTLENLAFDETTIATPPSCVSVATSTSTPGNYATVCSGAADPSYSFSYESGTALVSKGGQQIAFTSPEVSGSYGSTFTVAPAASSGLELAFTASGGCSASPHPETVGAWVVVITSGTLTCYLTASHDGDGNWEAAEAVTRAVLTARVAQPTLAVSPAAALVYGATVALNLTGGAGAGVIEFTAGGACTPYGGTLTVAIISGTGFCSLTVTRAGDANYLATELSDTFEVERATQPPLVWVSPASLVYGASTSITVSGGVSTGGFTFDVGGPCHLSSTDATAEGVTVEIDAVAGSGSCSLSATRSGDTNWEEATGRFELELAPATLAVSATDTTSVYGDPDGALGHTVTGFVSGDTKQLLSGVARCTRQAGRGVGSYTVTCTPGTLTATNYVFTTGNGAKHTITRRPVTVQASNIAFRHGSPVPAVGYTLSNLALDDSTVTTRPTCSTLATSSSAPGTYPAVCSGAEDPSYSFTYEPGAATVAKGTQELRVRGVPAAAALFATFTVTAAAGSQLTPALRVRGACNAAASRSARDSWEITPTDKDSVCALVFTQAGDENWEPAPPVVRTVALTESVTLDEPTSTPSAGQGNLILPDGTQVPLVIERLASGDTQLAAGPVTIALELDEAGNLPARIGELVTLRGAGYRPLSLVELTLFSTPTRLGTVRADGSGAFSVAVVLPASVPAGRHTLQIAGVGEDGRSLTVEVGVGLLSQDRTDSLDPTKGNDSGDDNRATTTQGEPPAPRSTPTGLYLAIGAGVVAAFAALVRRRRVSRRS